MIFNNTQPIYLQILEMVYQKILRGEWTPSERIPSVRDLAVLYEVNPNTVMRTYERLQQEEIIFNRRGMGYYLSPDAIARINQYARSEFIHAELPKIFEKMRAFALSPEEINQLYTNFIKQSI